MRRIAITDRRQMTPLVGLKRVVERLQGYSAFGVALRDFRAVLRNAFFVGGIGGFE